ncbi:membrane-associated, eicosanoid/glutathione metabolism (MAPEG) protein [Rhodotorula toruloides]|uniref:Membrane-associated, eicosanoid/glutathione metabolism (MAPEG) protein n=1 Tax=Rhodotorula toruloides TaxID=5286 RepID=A0A511KM75_RHOTO|nr:membrane-associated, eicosanoid/glutathione metabolism (MAPEG) protein [Rhodotorula toruloides]
MSTLSVYNYSLLSIPAVWALGISTHWHAILLSARSKEIPKFDNVAPRQFNARMGELAKASKDAREFLRTEAAQQNIFENIALYAAAIVVGNVARLPVSYLNKVALGYLASRLAFVICYAKTEQEKYTPIRSLAYLASMILTLGVFVKAGSNFNKALY